MNAVGVRLAAILRKAAVPLAVTVAAACAAQFGLTLFGEVFLKGQYGDAVMGGTGLGWLGFVIVAVTYWCHAVHAAAVSEIAIRTDSGKPIEPLRLLISALMQSVVVVVLTVVVTLGGIIGGLFLLVPGLFFATAFSIVVPVYVAERGNWLVTFRRAFQLTKGHRWQIFFIWLVVGLVMYGWNHALSGQAPLSELRGVAPDLLPEGWPEDGPPLIQYSAFDPVARGLVTLASTVILAGRLLLNAVIYLALRAEKAADEGPGVAEVFE